MDKYIKIKDFRSVVNIIPVRWLPFKLAQFLFQRSLEIQTLKDINFRRPALEIGTGNGFITSLFFSSKFDYGVDIKKRAINRYKKAYKEIFFIDPQTNKLPFKDSSLGSIYSISVLEHAVKLDLLLAECQRVLKKNGLFVVNVNTNLCKEEPLNFTKTFAPNLLSSKDWIKCICKNGFEVINTRYVLPRWVLWVFETRRTLFTNYFFLVTGFLMFRFWEKLEKFAEDDISESNALTVTFICRKR